MALNKWSVFLSNVLLVLCVCTYASDERVIGNLKRVVDGDTIYLKTGANNSIKVRLAFIDAPELNQPFGTDAKAFLKKIEGQRVTIDVKSRDRYGRHIAILFHRNADINLVMIENGYAWVYTKYLKHASKPIRNKYLHAEFLAKENALGLWKMNDYIAPWEWRKHSRKRRREN